MFVLQSHSKAVSMEFIVSPSNMIFFLEKNARLRKIYTHYCFTTNFVFNLLVVVVVFSFYFSVPSFSLELYTVVYNFPFKKYSIGEMLTVTMCTVYRHTWYLFICNVYKEESLVNRSIQVEYCELVCDILYVRRVQHQHMHSHTHTFTITFTHHRNAHCIHFQMCAH